MASAGAFSEAGDGGAALPSGTGIVKVVASVPALVVAGTDAVVPGVQTVGQILAAAGTGAAPGVQVGAAGGFYEASGTVGVSVGGSLRAQFSGSTFNLPAPYIAVIGGGLRFGAAPTKTANYTLAIGTDHTVLGDATGGAFDLSLPDASTVPGAQFTTKKIDASANAVTTKSAGGTIDGVAASTGVALGTQGQARTFESNGTNWLITGGYL